MWDWFLKFSVPRTKRIIGMLKAIPKANCSKPLAVIGLETTGLNPAQDRITKITILRIEPSNAVTSYVQQIDVNDGSPCPSTASRHRRSLPFVEVHRRIRSLLINCNVVGYNLKQFTLAFLMAEFERVGSGLSIPRDSLIDLEAAD